MLRRFAAPTLCATPFVAARCSSSAPIVDELKAILQDKNAKLAPKINELKTKYGNENLSDATVDKAYGGMRDIISLVYEPSLLDPQEGIRFRGLSIPECQQKLPKAAPGGEPLPEAMFWLLLTGDVPTEAQTKALSKELVRRADPEVIKAAKKVLDASPASTHPMTQLSMGILALQTGSKFHKAYSEGKATKKNYWELALEDSLDCIARTPSVGAMIYNRITKGTTDIVAPSEANDWAANFAIQMGKDSDSFKECLRLYLSIHTDHEGGNVSAHTTTLVGSALSDPYYALSAGMCGLAGPLHGLANQEVLTYIFDMREKCKAANVDVNDHAALKAALTKFTWDLLNAKRVVPGYGHAVLRKTDPRYSCQRDFCTKHMPEYELFKLVNTIYEIMPGILTEHGKTKNPYPNVDAHSGVLLQYYGLTEQNFYTVLFGISRQLGVLPGLIWDRLQGRPIERPKSVTTEWLCKKFNVQ